MPWPLAPREVVLRAVGFEDIEANGDIAIKLDSRHTGDEEGLVPPPVEKGATRVDFHGGFLFRPCPKDHKAMKEKRAHSGSKRRHSDLKDDIILVSFCMVSDAKNAVLPRSFILFVLKTALGKMWNKLMKVAEDVRDGKRPEHKDAIIKKRGTLYDWVDGRANLMFSLFRSARDTLSNHRQRS